MLRLTPTWVSLPVMLLTILMDIGQILGFLYLTDKGKALGGRSSCIAEAAGYIDGICGDGFDLRDISETVYLSKYHLIRKLRNEMGITLGDCKRSVIRE